MIQPGGVMLIMKLSKNAHKIADAMLGCIITCHNLYDQCIPVDRAVPCSVEGCTC